ncbi:acyltransferase [Yimella sp. RIT 621]|uniref:acyltransferase family protein n=1 Tax=Yimella sp. RIT 621 TaxID=2510323 RepID=UPI00101BCA0F|nr:acyltransferase family protein [Yimella sp. RIT 621]RYG77744.1 acyltransferase [Yimella sp. RIT 621]
MAKHKSLPYRPALDGLRGVAVAAVVVFHLNKSALPGGWLGVDLFFVLSGFLITSLLLTEHNRWGRISLGGFWASRARRLLPSLVLMLLAVLTASAFLAEHGRRPAIGGDVLAAFFYVANWRFLLGDEQYFATIAMPSPVRHTWSLSIEEQFYFVFPLLLAALLVVVRRRVQLAVVLGVLATASALWMSVKYVPGVDPSRVYYGTDTRIFELLIGAAAGALLGAHEFAERTRWRVDGMIERLAWPAIALFVSSFFLVDENSPFVFRGGLALLCLIAVVPIVAASARTRNSFQRLLGWEPLRGLGLISYSLYLWHWPVIVFLNAEIVANPWVRALAQVTLSLGLAYATWRFVEQPIRRGGFRALVPGRPATSRAVTIATVPLLLAGPFLVRLTPAPAATVRNVDLAVGTYVPLEERAVVTLIGNSIPESLKTGFDAAEYPDIEAKEVTSIGCDPFVSNRWRDGAVQPPSSECRGWKDGGWVRALGEQRPALTLFFVPQTTTGDWGDAGRKIEFGTPAYDRWLAGELTTLHRRVTSAKGGRFVVMNLACHRQTDFGFDPTIKNVNDDRRVQHVNRVVAVWAKQAGVPVIDQYKALCTGGYHGSVNGVPLYKDTLHFTPESARIMWSWLVPQLQTALQSRG